MSKIAVIALGGNSIIKEKEKGTIQEQLINSDDTNKCLVELVKKGYNVIITHGNGPQVGNILLRNEAANQMYDVPVMPLDICVADSEGGMGYMLQRSMFNILKKQGIKKNVVTVVTQVAVSKEDPAFKNPSKPVGPFYDLKRAEQLKSEKGWDIKEDPGRGYRRVVPSPVPVEIIEIENIRELVEGGNIVIAAGGGGVPVCFNLDGTLEAVEAVIDKDLASSLMARNLNADLFMILTGVPKIAVNFRKDNEKWLDEMTVEQAEKYIAEGQFPAGSMGPKVKAAVDYVKHCGREVVITSQEELGKEKFGTVIKK
ncbi:MAG: carbamate kinase [Candidatus Muirbacterium halophilum]|nr:carbamate kinase [Candidatus Muirbacterium halophilum]